MTCLKLDSKSCVGRQKIPLYPSVDEIEIASVDGAVNAEL